MKMFRTNSKAVTLLTRPFLVVGAAMLATILSTTAVFAAWNGTIVVSVGSQAGVLTYGTSGSATYTVSFTGGTGSGSITPSVISGLPTGAGSSFNPASVSGPPGGSTTLTITTTGATPAGAYTFTVRTKSGGNTGTGTLTVGKAPLTVTTVAKSKTYGETFNPANYSGTVTGQKNGDSITIASYASDGAAAGVNVGAYDITATLSDPGSKLGNYERTNNYGKLTVGAAPLTVTTVAKSKTYGDAFNPANYSGTVTGQKNGDSIAIASYASAGATAGANVGAYDITATLSDPGSKLGNYERTNNYGKLTVGAAPLTVTTVAKSKTYGDTFNPANYSGTVTGQKNGDPITIASYASDGAAPSAAAGAYDITATLSDPGSKLGNYALTNNYGKLTVIPATGQTWYLYNDDIMRKSLTPTASITINPHAFRVWTADQKAWSAVTFPDGSWVIYLKTGQDWSGSCTAEVGYWNGSFHPFTTGAPAKSWDSGTGILTIRAQAGSETINANDYLALRVTNNDAGSHDVITDGNSWVKSPASDPGYPLPELASGILFALGLAGTGTFIIIRRKKAGGFETHV
jgi:hypothetical protein